MSGYSPPTGTSLPSSSSILLRNDRASIRMTEDQDNSDRIS